MKDPGLVLKGTFEAFQGRLSTRPGFVIPTRQYAHVGEVVFDCDEFVVTINEIGAMSTAGDVERKQASNFGVTMSAVLVRCVPPPDNRGNPPSVAKLTAAAYSAGTDAQALQETFYKVFDTRSTDQVAGYCENVYYQGISFVGPEGNSLGTILSFAVQL